MENLSLNKYLKLIINNYKIIVYFAVGMTILAILLGIIVYRPVYQSTAKLMIKEVSPSRFVVPLGESAEVRTSQNKNPILNYMEMFLSKNVAVATAEKVETDSFLGKIPKENLVAAIQKSVNLKNIPGTEIIQFSFKWRKPEEAQKLAKNYIDSYIEHNVKMNKESVSQMRTYIEHQLEDSEIELKGIRDKIKEYKTANQSVNVEQESIAIIQQITNHENDLAEINKLLNSEKSKSLEISQKLSLDTENAIISAALGQNGNLQTLRRDLQVAQQKFAELNVRYTPLNPQIKSLNENIIEIKNQMASEIKMTIGNELVNVDKSIISDPVRTEMVNQLVTSQTNIQSLEAQKLSVENNLNSLKTKQSLLPEVQTTLQTLMQKETILANVVETLNTKLIEAKIRESEIVSNLSIINAPNLPSSPSFPTVFHLVLIFGFSGVLLGISTIIGKHYVEDTTTGSDEIEEIIKAPVLGIIPWLNEESYKSNSKEFTPLSLINIIYQKIHTSIKIKSTKKGINILGVTSADFEKRRSVISVNIAKSLAKAGNKVLLIDADFRGGCIAKEFDIESESTIDLSEMILDITKLHVNNPDGIQNEKIYSILNAGIKPVESCKNLYLISNNSSVNNPDEFIHTKAFSDLLMVTKEQFNYVIVDTPPILAVPDSINIAQYLDGLIILCGIKTSRTNLFRIRKTCNDNYIEILGVVARDSVTELEIPENMYIRQLNESID